MDKSEISDSLSCAPINEDFPSFIYWSEPLLLFPPIAVYTIRSLRYGRYSLMSVVNPGFPDSKNAILDSISHEHRNFIPHYCKFTRKGEPVDVETEEALRVLDQAGLSFPVVAKPDDGYKGTAVSLLEDAQDLDLYLSEYKDVSVIHFQEHIDWPGEVGIFYIRHPESKRGRIFSLNLKFSPCVIGDGISTIEKLIFDSGRPRKHCQLWLRKNQFRSQNIPDKGEKILLSFARNIAQGGIYEDITRKITPELTDVVDQISKGIPNFCFGRFDVKFNTLDELLGGKAFKILEINNCFSQDGRLYSRDTRSLYSRYIDLFGMYKEMTEIAKTNARNGFDMMTRREFLKL